MKTYPLKNRNGIKFGFEIKKVYIGVNDIAKLLSNLDGVSNIKYRRLFEICNEYHIAFNYQGIEFVVWEPYGDNSRYWICPKDESNVTNVKIDTVDIEKIFIQYRPPILIKIFGDLISLNFKALFKKK